MVVGEISESVDFLVIGGGPGGYTAALEAAALGREVVLVERGGPDGIGGVCLNVGCIPSKALIEVADAAHRCHELVETGLTLRLEAVSMPQFQQWKTGVVQRLNSGVRGLLGKAGVDVWQGEFRFTGPNKGLVMASDDSPSRYVEFRDAVIATGSTPIDLPGLPRDGVAVLDSTDVLALRDLPATVAVIGGGYIGVELGTALHKLGVAVTIVEARDSLLPEMDPQLVKPVAKQLQSLGVSVMTSTLVTDFDARTGCAVVRSTTDDQESAIGVDKVVVAVGRRPNTNGLGLDTIGVTVPPSGLLEVGKDRRITTNIAAIGDVTPGPALAHKATAEAVVAVAALCGRPAVFDPVSVPLIVFSDPEIATTASASQHDPENTEVARHPFTASGRALTMGAATGFVRMTVDPRRDVVIGVDIVGPHASELIGEAVLAVEMAASPVDVWSSIHPHPTLSEAIADVARSRNLQPQDTG